MSLGQPSLGGGALNSNQVTKDGTPPLSIKNKEICLFGRMRFIVNLQLLRKINRRMTIIPNLTVLNIGLVYIFRIPHLNGIVEVILHILKVPHLLADREEILYLGRQI